MSQHVVDHRRKRLWVGWIEAAGDPGRPDFLLLRSRGMDVLPWRKR
jgi:hypothetical protein